MAQNDQEHHSPTDEGSTGEASSDPGDAFEWLERLAADQGAPAEELPTVQGKEQEPIPPAEHIPDWLRELAPRTEPDQEQLPHPLAEELAGLAEDIPSPVDELPDWLQPIDDTQTAEVAPAADLPTFPTDAMVQDESTEPEAESVPAMTGTDKASEDDDAALAWLEQLATGQSAPEEDQPPLAEAGGIALPPSQPVVELDEMVPGDDVTRPAFPVPGPDVIANLEELGELPEDVDEAMAWLEALASRQAESVEEVSSPSVPAQPDAGAPPAVEEELPTPADKVATPIPDELTPPPPEEPEPTSAIDQPELPEWLREIAPEPAISAEATEPPEIGPTPRDDEPDLPEWLRDLSAVAPASMEKETEPLLPEPAPVAEEPELPEWLRAEAPVPAAAEESEPAALVDEPELPEWLRAEAPVPAAEEPITPEWLTEDTGEPDSMADEPEWTERSREEIDEPAAVEQEPAAPEWLRDIVREPSAMAETPQPPDGQREETSDSAVALQEPLPAAPAVEEEPPPPEAELIIEEAEFPEAVRPVAPMVESAEPLAEEQEAPQAVEAAPEPAAPRVEEWPPEPATELLVEETEVLEAAPQPVAPMVDMAEPLVEEQETPQAVETAPESAAPQVEEWPPEPATELLVEETEISEAAPLPIAPIVEMAEPLTMEAAPEPAAPRIEEEPLPIVEPDLVPADEPAAPDPAQTVTGMAVFRAQLAAEPGDHVTRLTLARALLDDDALDNALLEYGALVAAGQELDDVVEDLEHFMPSDPANTLALRILGDAHMKQGELSKALKAYRQALAHL